MLSRVMDHLISVMTIVLAGFAVWMMVERYNVQFAVPTDSEARPVPRAYEPNEQISGLPGIDLASGRRTLLVVMRSNCSYCTDSIPFYKRVLDLRANRGSDVQVVLVKPETDALFDDYLKEQNFSADKVIGIQPFALRIRGTPTLVLLSGSGRVEHVWESRLGTAQEEAVLSALFGEVGA